MQNFNVVYSDDATEQLKEIHDYILRNFASPETARGQTNRIMSKVKKLGLSPKIHRIRGKDKKGNEIRLCPVDNYSILYSVDDVKNVVNISHIVYGRRNISEII